MKTHLKNDSNLPSHPNCCRPDGDCFSCSSYDEDENICLQDDDLGCTGHGDDSYSDADF